MQPWMSPWGSQPPTSLPLRRCCSGTRRCRRWKTTSSSLHVVQVHQGSVPAQPLCHPKSQGSVGALHRGSREGALALGFIGIVGKIRPSFRLNSTTTAQLLHSTLCCFSNRSAFIHEVISTDTFWRSTLNIYPNSSLFVYSCRRNNSCGWREPGVPADQPAAQYHLHSLYVCHQRASHQPDHQHQLHYPYVQPLPSLLIPSQAPTPGKTASKAELKFLLHSLGVEVATCQKDTDTNPKYQCRAQHKNRILINNHQPLFSLFQHPSIHPFLLVISPGCGFLNRPLTRSLFLPKAIVQKNMTTHFFSQLDISHST